MDPTLDRIKDELDLLTTDQQAELLRYLIRSLRPVTDEDLDPEVVAAWEAEIERRVEQIESGEEKGVPAEEVFARLRAKYGRNAD